MLSGQGQSSLIYNDLPIGYTLKGTTMSSLRKDTKQHRSITAPFWQNQAQGRQYNYCQFYMWKQELQFERDFCDVALVCDDGHIGAHRFIIASQSLDQD